MDSTYKLTIAGYDHLQEGVYKRSIGSRVVELKIFKNGELIKQANLSAHPISIKRTLQATQNKITLLCKRLGINPEQLEYNRSSLSLSKKSVYLLLSLKRVLFEAFIPAQWIIVFKKTNEDKWQRIMPEPDVFQADPFIVYRDQKYFIFYEELKFEDYHGYLMAAELDIANKKLINEKIILKQGYHLSYPNVFEENGTYYMIPESADNRTVDLFECTDFPYKWEKKQTLLDNIQAVDTTPLKLGENWFLFTTEIVKGTECNDELSIYKSADLFNTPFVKIYDEPVISDVENARMAGHFLQHENNLYRISQNCGKRYGHQANINRVLQIVGGYKEEKVNTLKPDKGALGYHTYNQDNDIIVGDMEIVRLDFKFLKRFIGRNFSSAFNKYIKTGGSATHN